MKKVGILIQINQILSLILTKITLKVKSIELVPQILTKVQLLLVVKRTALIKIKICKRLKKPKEKKTKRLTDTLLNFKALLKKVPTSNKVLVTKIEDR